MEIEELISTENFCSYYQVEYTTIESFREVGLIETTIVNETQFIHYQHLEKIEQFIRLYKDLHINAEGIEAIRNLLAKMDEMKAEINLLKNQLRIFEVSA